MRGDSNILKTYEIWVTVAVKSMANSGKGFLLYLRTNKCSAVTMTISTTPDFLINWFRIPLSDLIALQD